MLIPSRLLSVVVLLASLENCPLHAADPPKSITEVHAPIRVGTPPSDSIAGLVRLESGEIRFYDYGDQVNVNLHHYPDRLPRNYLSSSDNGLTWELKPVPAGHFGADARSPISGAETWGIDRSVHQPQFVEVDQGRVLVSIGQHWLHRSLVLFDPAWLYETERRSDFSNGLDDWSVQGYFAGIRGHCALNRFPSATLVSDPDQPSRRVLEVRRTDRHNLLLPQSGATWNFPAGRAGTVETRIRLNKGFGGARISLLDRWLNPTDPTAHTLAMCHLDIAADGTTNSGAKIEPGDWHTLKFQWQSPEQSATCAVLLDDQPVGAPLTFQRPANHGVSYIHYQTTAEAADKGFLIGSVSAKAQP